MDDDGFDDGFDDMEDDLEDDLEGGFDNDFDNDFDGDFDGDPGSVAGDLWAGDDSGDADGVTPSWEAADSAPERSTGLFGMDTGDLTAGQLGFLVGVFSAPLPGEPGYRSGTERPEPQGGQGEGPRGRYVVGLLMATDAEAPSEAVEEFLRATRRTRLDERTYVVKDTWTGETHYLRAGS